MNINLLYFSPNGSTSKLAHSIGEEISTILKEEKLAFDSIIVKDITLIKERKFLPPFSSNDFVVFAMPVYAGRVPNFLLPYLNTLEGNGALASTICVYGNRAFDDSLLELNTILKNKDFQIISSAAFVGAHSFSNKIASNRPDKQDLSLSKEFGKRTAQKLILILNDILSSSSITTVPGIYPPKPYYTPRDSSGESVNFKDIKPQVLNSCTNCALCSDFCPVNNIDPLDSKKSLTYCIKCNACINKCPQNARYFSDSKYLEHKSELELALTYRRKPEFYF